MAEIVGSALVAEMVGSAVLQESVSRAVSIMLSKREEKASKRHTIERLEMAHHKLEFADERISKLPITDASLLRQRMKLKRAYDECSDVLHRCELRILQAKETGQGVTQTTSFPKRIFRTVKSSVSYLFSHDKDELCLSQVTRFEWHADEADKFVRNVESGCSLAHYRFFSPLITQLLEGKTLEYKMARGSKMHSLLIRPVLAEEHGVVAALFFDSNDCKIPTECFTIWLWLRLSESMDIVGLVTKCLQALGPQFKTPAEAAVGELSQLPTQDFHSPSVVPASCFDLKTSLSSDMRPDPLCCIANGRKTCANNIAPSELSYRFPEQVAFMRFHCCISAFKYNLQGSADEAERNVVNNWPPLKLSAHLGPHSVRWKIGGQKEHTNALNYSLQQMEEMVVTNAINCFIRQPELTEYEMDLYSPHGTACFRVEKPRSEMVSSLATNSRCKTRRAARRRC